MQDINRVTLVGNIGQTPELKEANGKPVCRLRIATTETWDGGSKTEWHNVVVWGKQAEWAAEYQKGTKVFVEGQLETNTYKDKDGNEKKDFRIKATRISEFVRHEVKKSEKEENEDIPF